MPSETLVADDLADALAYQRRKPEDTVLYRVVQQNLETFLASAREQGRVVPRFVERERSCKCARRTAARSPSCNAAAAGLPHITTARTRTAAELPIDTGFLCLNIRPMDHPQPPSKTPAAPPAEPGAKPPATHNGDLSPPPRSSSLIERLRRHERLFQACLRARTLATLPLRPRHVAAYLDSSDEPKLHLGAGRLYYEGWLNTDYLAKPPRFIYLNATKPFPLPDDTFRFVYSEHMIEHIPFPAGIHMMKECRRVLAPGGIVRIETPDLRVIAGLYQHAPSPDDRRYMQFHAEHFSVPSGHDNALPTPCIALNSNMRNWGHQFVYDEETLRHVFEIAGFTRIKVVPTGSSEHPTIDGLEARDTYGEDARFLSRFETLALEGTKEA